MHNKVVSIVLPTYNGAKYIKQSISSCLNQTYSNLELIIVVDGSIDNTLDIINSYSDARLKTIVNNQNLGLPNALNAGFAITKGYYLTWTSDDNIYKLTAIELMVNYLNNNPSVGLVCSPFWEIDGNGNIIKLCIPKPMDMIWEANTVGACFLYKRKVYETIGNYNPNAKYVEDYEYWLKTSLKFHMHSLEIPLYFYRIHDDALTNIPGLIFDRSRLASKIRRRNFNRSWHSHWLKMSQIDIEEAFANYRDGETDRIPILVIRGVLRNPIWLRNRGVLSIFLKSVLSKINVFR